MVTSRNLAVIHWNYLDKLIASYIITMVVAAASSRVTGGILHEYVAVSSPGPRRPQEDLVSQGFLESVLSDCVVPGSLLPGGGRLRWAVVGRGGLPGWAALPPGRHTGGTAAPGSGGAEAFFGYH